MESTYTYTARSVDDPEQVVTFTLRDNKMAVEPGAPLEQMDRMLELTRGDDSENGSRSRDRGNKPWVKPLAVTLLQRGMGPFRISDVEVDAKEEHLRVSAWYRVGGLALAPVSLVDGRVDNALAARGFAEEVERRKLESVGMVGGPKILDYWLTWIMAAVLLNGMWKVWRLAQDETD